MKNKKILVFIASLFFSFLAIVSGQYFEFTGNNTFQQGCTGSYDIYYDTKGLDITVGDVAVVMDSDNLLYSTLAGVASRDVLFSIAGSKFGGWTSNGFPSWKDTDKTKLSVSLTRQGSNSNGLYGSIIFVPKWNSSSYDSMFVFSYNYENPTYATTLNMNNSNRINLDEQSSRFTGEIHIVQKPCLDDTTSPVITINNYLGNINYNNGLDLSITDSKGNGVVPYVWTGDNIWTGNKWDINNQYGVDLSSIVVTVSGINNKVVLYSGDFEIIPLNKTWQNKDRDYRLLIGSGALFDFGVEEKVVITVDGVKDRNGNITSLKSLTINNPVRPTISNIYPANGSTFVPSSAIISFKALDAWAGINTGSISVVLSGINEDAEDYNYDFYGSALDFSKINGDYGLGKSGGYFVSLLSHEKFPALGKINVSVSLSDLKGNNTGYSWSFTASPKCSDLACCSIDISLGENGVYNYGSEKLYISGADNVSVNTGLTEYIVNSIEYTGWITEINCNLSYIGLSIYKGIENDGNVLVSSGILNDEIVLSGNSKTIKAELLRNTLFLQRFVDIDDVTLITPIGGIGLTTGNVEFQWSLSGDDDKSWFSGYIFTLYSGNNIIFSKNVYSTTIILSGDESLLDGIYERSVVAEDLGGHRGETKTGNFIVDKTGPDFEILNRSGYECEEGYLEIGGERDALSSILEGGYSFDGINWGTGKRIIIEAQMSTGIVVKTGYVRDELGNTTEKTGTYEFINTGVSVETGILYIGTISGEVRENINDLIGIYGAREGNCGTGGLTIELISCSGATGSIEGGELKITPNNEVEEDGECEMVIKDGEGSEKYVLLEYSIDTQAPICIMSYSPAQGSGKTNQDVIVIFDCGADGSTGYTFTGNGNTELSVKDEAGNETTGGAVVDWIDRTAPRCSVSFDVETWTSGNVLAILTGCTEEVIGGTGHEFTENGKYTFEYRDEAGNTGSTEADVTWIDKINPEIASLVGGVGESCTNETGFVITGIFDEEVVGVTINSLTGENINIISFNGTGNEYAWEVELLGGTGYVEIVIDGITDLIGNPFIDSTGLVIGNYDNVGPTAVYLVFPGDGDILYNNSINFEWTESIDTGIGGISYVLEICGDENCNNITRSGEVYSTGKVEGSISNGTGYWRVVSMDSYGNKTYSDIGYFVVDSNNPNCTILQQESCTSGSVNLILTGDKNIFIFNSGGIEWTGIGMYYTGVVNGNENVVVVVNDSAGHTGQCELSVTRHDEDGPEIKYMTGEVNECEGISIEITAIDSGCAAGISGYKYGLEYGNELWQENNELIITAEQIGRTGNVEKQQNVTVVDKIGNERTGTGYGLSIVDVKPELGSGVYSLSSVVTGDRDIGNMILILGASEGNCGTGDLKVKIRSCSGVNGSIEGGNLILTPNDEVEGEGKCEIVVEDNEGSEITGEVKYYVDTKKPSCNIEYYPMGITSGNVLGILTGCNKTGIKIVGIDVITGGEINQTGGNGTGIEFTGNGSGIITIEDENGNRGVIEVGVDNIDRIVPECEVIYEPNIATSGEVIVTITCNEDVIVGGIENLTGSEISTGMGTGKEIKITENGTGIIIVEDEAGNEKEIEISIDNIDRTAPECEVIYEPNTATSGDVVAIISCNEGVKVRELSGENLIGSGELGIIGTGKEIKITENGTGIVIVEDEVGNEKEIEISIDNIDRTAPECTVSYTPEGITSGNVLSLLSCNDDNGVIITNNDGTGIYLFEENGNFLFEFSDNIGNIGSLLAEVTGIDKILSSFVFNSNSGNECETGYLEIISDDGTGVGLHELPYKFDTNDWSFDDRYLLFKNSTGVISISGYARDRLGNISSGIAEYVFNDVELTGESFSIVALSGVTINWKDLSHISEGLCDVSYITGEVVSGGTIGNCTVSGDNITYMPENTYVTGSDLCVLSINDDEGNNINITIEFTDINADTNTLLIIPQNGAIFDEGNINLSWDTTGYSSSIKGYVYNVWTSDSIYTGFVTNSGVSIPLGAGAYSWNVYVIYDDDSTGGISDTFTFNLTTKKSSGGGGGGSHLSKDRCPDGDQSDSYYDGICEANGTHGSSTGDYSDDFCGVNLSNYSDEQKFAYLYSYNYGITTICPIQDADIDGYLIRSHFAKMISEFAVNVLGKVPEHGKEGCNDFGDIAGESDELKHFMKTSCELSLMGLNQDGFTPKKNFDPNDYVTRAQFGTVLSRLLFGEKYNIKDGSEGYTQEGIWYKKHLQALNDYGIMTKIDGDWPNYFERRGWVMLMLERSDNYGLFAGKIPSENGLSALFDE